MKWVEILPEYIKAFAIVVGAGWAYWKFIYQRQREPATDIDIDVRFVGVQQEKWVIEVTCVLENKSLVRHTYRDFQVTVRYLEHTDEIIDGAADINYQLKATKTIDDRIGKAKRFFAGVDVSNLPQDAKAQTSRNQNYINPRQQFRHRYVTWIPISASFIWVQCKFNFSSGWRRKQKMNSQRVFRVPDVAENKEIKDAEDKLNSSASDAA
jgi:hypothetical protein